MRCRTILVACLLVLQGLPAQDLRWQIPQGPSGDILHQVMPFVDFDGDGYRDLLLHRERNYAQPNWTYAIEVLSGRDASLLWETTSGGIIRARDAGDIDGDGQHDIALVKYCCAGPLTRVLEMWSTATNQVIWQNTGPFSGDYGRDLLGDLDVDGDGLTDFVTITSDPTDSRVFVYDNSGATRYVLNLVTYGMVISVGKMGDMNGDGGDDFLVGINDGWRGVVLLVSGMTGAILRTSYGLQPGDKTCDFASNIGDIDADGVDDYAAFPWLTAQRAIVVAWSGQTGLVIRTWDEFANSVIVGEDFDLDGVPDMAIGADWQIAPNVYGSTRVYSGRDGLELWRINNAPFTPYGQGSSGFYGWMEYSASLGVQPGDAYPTIAWIDIDWWQAGSYPGRVRAYRTNYAEQGPIVGTPCSNYGTLPLIGARKFQATPITQRARITVARGPAGGGAWLNFGFANQTSYGGVPLPIDLAAYGLPGCNLYVGPITSAFTVLGATGIDSGYGHFDMVQRLTSATTGVSIVAQWLLFDPVTLSYGGTARHQLKVQ